MRSILGSEPPHQTQSEASVSVTMDVYSHVLPDMQEKAAVVMDALLSESR
jgi:hypothetical protein